MAGRHPGAPGALSETHMLWSGAGTGTYESGKSSEWSRARLLQIQELLSWLSSGDERKDGCFNHSGQHRKELFKKVQANNYVFLISFFTRLWIGPPDVICTVVTAEGWGVRCPLSTHWDRELTRKFCPSVAHGLLFNLHSILKYSIHNDEKRHLASTDTGKNMKRRTNARINVDVRFTFCFVFFCFVFFCFYKGQFYLKDLLKFQMTRW